jgi:DNA-binding NarL/FixJ family response regulator
MEALCTLIPDDHHFFHYGIREFLNLAQEIQVVGEVANREEAVTQAEALYPDGCQHAGINGIEATRRILHASPHIRILVVTIFIQKKALRLDTLRYVK